MAQRLTKGETPSWSVPAGQPGSDVMDRVADSTRPWRARKPKPRKPASASGKQKPVRSPKG